MEIRPGGHQLFEHGHQGPYHHRFGVAGSIQLIEGIHAHQNLIVLGRGLLPRRHAQGIQCRNAQRPPQDVLPEDIVQVLPNGTAAQPPGKRHGPGGAGAAYRLRHLLDRGKTQPAVAGRELDTGEEQAENGPFHRDFIKLQLLFHLRHGFPQNFKLLHVGFPLYRAASR